jgi:hypothetical protein
MGKKDGKEGRMQKVLTARDMIPRDTCAEPVGHGHLAYRPALNFKVWNGRAG